MAWDLWQGDCLKMMDLIDDKSIDMILCDLPYGTTQNKWDAVIPFEPLWAQYKRIIKDRGAVVLTAQTPFDKVLGCSNIGQLKYEWIWEKAQGSGHLNAKKYPLKNHENILVFCAGVHTYNPQMVEGPARKIKRSGNKANTTNYGNFTEIKESEYSGYYPKSILRFDRDSSKIHPTQKPVALFEYLIKTYTNEGETILDNCAGSGTTGVAAERCGRNSILIEQDAGYCNIIRRRMDEHSLNRS